jgi:hypothetical protein
VGIQSTAKFVDVPVAPIGSGNTPPVQPVRPGAVTAQQPFAGSRVFQSAQVTLTVAK